jgi:anaerobic nitric oxide reductase transcription regulator
VRSLRLSPDSEQALCRYGWPGNVRELEHVISRAAIKALSRGAARTDIITLEPDLLDLASDPNDSAAAVAEAGVTPYSGSATGAATDAGPAPASLQLVTHQAQRRAVEQALAHSKHNWAAAARLLEIDASNLHKLARRLGMK